MSDDPEFLRDELAEAVHMIERLKTDLAVMRDRYVDVCQRWKAREKLDTEAIDRLTKERDARPAITREDARLRSTDGDANDRILDALYVHAKGGSDE